MLRNKKRENLLQMKPVLKERYRLEPLGREDGGIPLYQILVPRDSWLERLSVRYLKQPAELKVKLDRLGSFVLCRCQGKRTVEELADLLSETFGEEADPVLPRLVKYLQIMEANGWIRMESK